MNQLASAVLIVAAVVISALIAIPAQAGMTPVKETELRVDNLYQDGTTARGIGSIETVKKCRQGREVTLEGADGLIGSDSTSANGAWVIVGEGDVNSFAEVVVRAKVVGKGNKRVKCGKDVVTLL